MLHQNINRLAGINSNNMPIKHLEIFYLNLNLYVSQEIKISAIIPTYNRAELAMRAIASVLKQTAPVDEIIIVDDGSTDDIAEKLKRVPQQITVLYQQHAGVSAARNCGIRTAQNNWLAFLDSDDIWLPNKIMRQKQAVSDNRCEICYTDEVWYKNGQFKNQGKKHQKYSMWIYEKCLPLCIISPSSVIIHRAVFDTVGVFDENMPVCEDYDLWLRIASVYPVFFLPEKLIEKHAGDWHQLSKQHSLDKYRIIALVKMLGNGHLNKASREATITELAKKCSIYIQGCIKHGRFEDVNWADAIQKEYGQLINL
jgi:glycosyltransferase involved in cell wall biosynthesis